MKLSTLYEARDPKKEAELEPYLTAPFYNHPQRASHARKAAAQSLKAYGVPDRQFMPHPDLDYKDNTRDPGWYNHYQHRTSFPATGKTQFPVLGTGNVRPTPNVKSDTSSLSKAIGYWAKNFEGQRWPALEQAFLNRDFAFKGRKGMYDTARSSLFKYLNELKQPWAEGEQMANTVLGSRNGLWYITKAPEVRRYVEKRPIIPAFVDSIKEQLKLHDQRMQDWKIRHDKWVASQNVGQDFHADDDFGYSNEPQPPLWRWGNEEWFKKYVAGDFQPKPPGKSEAEQFNDRLREIEERPPFAGWA